MCLSAGLPVTSTPLAKALLSLASQTSQSAQTQSLPFQPPVYSLIKS